MFNKKLKEKLEIIERDLHAHSHRHGVLIKRKTSIPEQEFIYGMDPIGVIRKHPEITHEYVRLEKAVQMIIDYLGLEYEDGKPSSPKLVKGGKR